MGYGGGIYVGYSGSAGGTTVTLTNSTVRRNEADGIGDQGGGIFIAAGAVLSLDEFTLSETVGNTPDDIDGSYILI